MVVEAVFYVVLAAVALACGVVLVRGRRSQAGFYLAGAMVTVAFGAVIRLVFVGSPWHLESPLLPFPALLAALFIVLFTGVFPVRRWWALRGWRSGVAYLGGMGLVALMVLPILIDIAVVVQPSVFLFLALALSAWTLAAGAARRTGRAAWALSGMAALILAPIWWAEGWTSGLQAAIFGFSGWATPPAGLIVASLLIPLPLLFRRTKQGMVQAVGIWMVWGVLGFMAYGMGRAPGTISSDSMPPSLAFPQLLLMLVLMVALTAVVEQGPERLRWPGSALRLWACMTGKADDGECVEGLALMAGPGAAPPSGDPGGTAPLDAQPAPPDARPQDRLRIRLGLDDPPR